MRHFFDNKMFYGQMYRNELAANLRELGYQIEPGKYGLFEIAGVDKSIREEFSRRSQQIKEMMSQLREKYPNANDSELKEMATLGSRAAKDKKADITAIRENWIDRLQSLDRSKDGLNQAIDETMKDHAREVMTAGDAIRKAAEIITAQESAFSREDLLRHAGRFSLGRSRIADLERAAKKLIQSRELVSLSDGTFTTPGMQQLEQEIVTMMQGGQGKFSPIMNREEVQRAINGRGLTDSQRDFILHAMTARDQVIGVQGYAGVGKTFALDTFRQLLESRGLTVKALAYTGKAADGITTEAKIESSTIAKDSHESKRADWIIVDEASMAGSRDIHSILKRAKAEGIRVLLIGDTEQLQAINAGRIFKDLIHHGMATVEMKQVVRQENGTYKDIVQSIIEKRIHDAFEKLDSAGQLHEIKDQEERLAAVAKDYTDRPDWRKSVVLSAKNADTRELNTLIRAILQQRGEIGRQDHEIAIRTPVSLQPAEQHFALSYKPGQYIFARKAGAGGMKAGAEARIIEIDTEKQMLLVRDTEGIDRTIDLIKSGCDISTYEEQQDRFSEREKIIFTKSDSKLRVRNGQTGEILKIDDDGRLIISMQDGSTRHIDPATYPYINHGDAVTTYKAQGMSQHNVIVNAPADVLQTYNAMYVQATRGKFDLQIYTDSREKLIERVKVEQEKTSTLEMHLDERQMNKQPEISVTHSRAIEMER